MSLLDGRSQPAGRTLVVRSAEVDEKSTATIDEDLKIMAKILDKAMDSHHDESARKAMGITVYTGCRFKLRLGRATATRCQM